VINDENTIFENYMKEESNLFLYIYFTELKQNDHIPNSRQDEERKEEKYYNMVLL
jgi:hypothetical protein